MTNKQWEKYADKGRAAASKKLQAEPELFKKYPIRKWEAEEEKALKNIERRQKSGYYENNPEAALKDWTDLYVARIICYNAANRME